MILQGICSGIFHLCPGFTSLQFDTTVMYIMLILSFIKIYQFRHPDLVFEAFHVMYSFSILIAMEAASIYISSTISKVVFNLIFIVLYTVGFSKVSIDCYYYGVVDRHNFNIILEHSIKNFGSFQPFPGK